VVSQNGKTVGRACVCVHVRARLISFARPDPGQTLLRTRLALAAAGGVQSGERRGEAGGGIGQIGQQGVQRPVGRRRTYAQGRSPATLFLQDSAPTVPIGAAPTNRDDDDGGDGGRRGDAESAGAGLAGSTELRRVLPAHVPADPQRQRSSGGKSEAGLNGRPSPPRRSSALRITSHHIASSGAGRSGRSSASSGAQSHHEERKKKRRKEKKEKGKPEKIGAYVYGCIHGQFWQRTCAPAFFSFLFFSFLLFPFVVRIVHT